MLEFKPLASTTTGIVQNLLDLLGWKHATTGKKSVDFSPQMQVLGVTYWLESFWDGSATVANRESRVERILGMLNSYKCRGAISASEAATMHGLLNFAGGFVIGTWGSFLLGFDFRLRWCWTGWNDLLWYNCFAFLDATSCDQELPSIPLCYNLHWWCLRRRHRYLGGCCLHPDFGSQYNPLGYGQHWHHGSLEVEGNLSTYKSNRTFRCFACEVWIPWETDQWRLHLFHWQRSCQVLSY